MSSSKVSQGILILHPELFKTNAVPLPGLNVSVSLPPLLDRPTRVSPSGARFEADRRRLVWDLSDAQVGDCEMCSMHAHAPKSIASYYSLVPYSLVTSSIPRHLIPLIPRLWSLSPWSHHLSLVLLSP